MAGQAIARALRPVMIGYGLGQFGGKPFGQGIMITHIALQFRKLPHHFRHKIEFGEEACLPGQFAIGPANKSELAGKRRDPFGLVMDAAELFVKHQCPEFGFPFRCREAFGTVGIAKKTGVVEPCGQYPLIAARDGRAAVTGGDIGDGDEFGREFRPVRLARRGGFDGEEFLMCAHRGGDDLGRKLEKVRVHVAHHGNRPFGEPGDFLKQAGILDQCQILSRT